MKICFILGTRPEIIKLSSLLRFVSTTGRDFLIIHTNQHYSEKLDKIFFEELLLPVPKYDLEIGSGTHGEQTGNMLIKIERVLLKERPDIVLVQGDTNSALAGALAAVKLHIKVGHIEAGLRSYDRTMPEEINRILIDHCSDFLFAPTESAKEILLKEGVQENKVHVSGNTVVDAVFQNSEIAESKADILEKLGIKDKGFFLLTIHRQENVDNKDTLRSLFVGLRDLARLGYPIVFPIHPRTKKMIKTFGLDQRLDLLTIDPVSFLEFLELEKHARLILTDSGGVQEEACILHTPCITLRNNTERPETVRIGANMLAGTDSQAISRAVETMLKRTTEWKNPFGDGRTYEKIVRVLQI